MSSNTNSTCIWSVHQRLVRPSNSRVFIPLHYIHHVLSVAGAMSLSQNTTTKFCLFQRLYHYISLISIRISQLKHYCNTSIPITNTYYTLQPLSCSYPKSPLKKSAIAVKILANTSPTFSISPEVSTLLKSIPLSFSLS